MTDDERFMSSALSEARKSFGRTSPNPAVGAVLVVRNRIVARGHHRQAGLPHAEIECLKSFRSKVPKDATLYVTLEPCSTTGHTGACTDQIVRAGVKSVVIGATDPNPRHRGRGVEILRDAGIEVRTGVLAEECAALNEAFNKWIATGIPFVIAKCGMSLDGRLTRPERESRWITSATSRQHAQTLRGQTDAILIGAETLRIDNPRLTARSRRQVRQPARVVMTRSGKLPRSARFFTDRFAKNSFVYRKMSLGVVLAELGQKKITSVMIEGGGDILGHALDERLIDKVQIYVAPIFTGGPVVAFGGRGAPRTHDGARLERVKFERIGPDIYVTGYPKYDRAASL
ncbi:MAG TPA: bifunctional diaminohydroxyphosphoribosylaminopyrimidine deaminase/5-amino-6-(5-phosphoribosylamino)uracil reductase RibD [Chthoniobacterales bacterium]|jgi:diaminohydroxyphosphoribosylaminopyrimidine deaminase/5-amino-6-(5-phosphoribosylamino)uracil reductase|nr:bifunctional diaminohydroxyphosphoribosylaminopyrimidine deaminase/5-amino-6-(5-phosphoribosylamino)uracil reductase RibD [Chthoniobacterales bacterium]